jgi:outer membrane protein OmpA-like peptidoglycan-associated protein
MKFQRTLSAALTAVLMGSGLAVLSTPASAALDTDGRDCDWSYFPSGNGSEANPFQIADASDLNSIESSECENEDAYFVLVADIDLSNIEDWDPIGGDGSDYFFDEFENIFDGQFDGNNFEISGLDISVTGYAYYENIGLFGWIEDATIENLVVSGDVSVESYYDEVEDECFEGWDIGGVVGQMYDSELVNVTSNVNVEGGEQVGGLAGRVTVDNDLGSSIRDSHSTGTVTGDGYCGADEVGGLVGYLNRSEIRNSTSSSAVSTDGLNEAFSIGGLVGESNLGIIYESSATGSVYLGEGDNVGGLVGYNSDTEIDGSFSSALVTVTGEDSYYIGGLIGQFEASCVDATTGISQSYATGNVVAGLAIGVGGLVGYFDSSDCEDSDEVASYVIDSYATGDVRGEAYVGGLFGENTPRTVTDSYATGDVTQTSDTDSYVGGFAGRVATFSSVINSYATGDVLSSADEYTGGFAGYVSGEALLYGVYATGDVTMESACDFDCNDMDDIGGLVGNLNDDSSIVRSYATGDVGFVENDETDTYNVGGLVGQQSGNSSILSSYATGDVEGYSNVGGLLGWHEGGVQIRNVYARGNVSGHTDVAGLIGDIDDENDHMTATYSTGSVTATDGEDSDPWATTDEGWFDNTVTNFYIFAGLQSETGATGVTEAELKDPQTAFAAGWSIRKNGSWAAGKAWAVCGEVNDGLPYLSWQVKSDPCPCVAVVIPNIQFAASSPVLSDAAKAQLDAAAVTIAASKCKSLTLTGFTSTLKATTFAKKLARARIANVKNYLIDRLWDLDHSVMFSTSIQNRNTKNPADRKVTTVALAMKR